MKVKKILKPEIKQRIKQIQKSVVPEGYKKTKVGIVPDEWDDATLGSFGDFYKGKGIIKEQLTKEGKNCVRYGEIYTTHDTVIKEFTSFVDEDVAYASTQICKGDILFVGSGETPEDIGKSVAFMGEEEAYAGGDIIIFRQNRENTLYLAYLLNGTEVNRQRYKYGEGHSVVHLYMDDIKRILVTLPPLPEQEKIAKILSTWDKAIELKEQLIAGKKQQKKWLMQNLLTGKKRLSGFTEEWQEVRLGEVCIVIMGQSPDSKAYNEDKAGIPLIQGNADCQGRLTKPRIWTTQITRICNVGDIIFTVRAPVGAVAIADQKACIGRGVSVIRSKHNQHYQHYMYHYLLSIEDKWSRVSQGSTFDAINGDEIKKVIIRYPSESEQTAIAEILSTADREIDLHEKQLDELKKQKKALMQLLLTGLVRVNV